MSSNEPNNSSINKMVLSGADDNIDMINLPPEVRELLKNMNPTSNVEVTQAMGESKKNKAPVEEPLMPKLTYSPDSGFSMSEVMLAKLNAFSPTPVEDVKSTHFAINIEESISFVDNDRLKISSTNSYTPKESNDLIKSFIVDEEGIFLGITIGLTNKPQAINIISQYSGCKFEENTSESILAYDDIALTIYLDDNDIVNQLEFAKDFTGATSKGLKMGDLIDKAVELYGAPKMKSPRGAMWSNLKIFCSDGNITSIKIQK
ncbi:MAG: hypothetical protein H7263_14400 [Candidatus Sericytochromatia bacterium]|nr:hypothetical protein [Candidatus Sericytochromatia bacterium]